jgi:cell division protein DivIC
MNTTSRRSRLTSGKILMRITIGLIFVFAVASAVAIYFNQEAQMQRILEKKEILARQLSEAEANQADLQELQNLADTDEYVERIARDKLGMVKPNEIVFDD